MRTNCVNLDKCSQHNPAIGADQRIKVIMEFTTSLEFGEYIKARPGHMTNAIVRDQQHNIGMSNSPSLMEKFSYRRCCIVLIESEF